MDEEVFLTDLIEVEILQKLQNSFSEMTGMAALTADRYGHPVTEGSNFTDFCFKYTRQAPLGFSRCMRCDKTGAELTMESGKACSYYCHAGLMDFAAPIKIGNKMVGSFIGGQVLPTEPNLDEFRKTASELGIDPDEYVEAVKRVRVVPPEQIARSADFLCVVAESLSFLASRSYELRRSNYELETASRMKSDFLANMSHEIRTPMNAVQGMVDLALREEMSDVARDYVRQIKASAKNLLVIINDILDFSKIESGKMDIINVGYEPLSIINDLSSIANSRIGTKNIEFIIDVYPNMPKMIFGDNVRIHQILLNIINNAIKFTQKGEVRLSLDYEQAEGDMLIMRAAVADTGIGIKKEDFDKLFNSFQQVDSKRNRNIEGTGLGLAITKNLLSLMGGNITVKSEYGSGSTFTMEVPQKSIDKSPAVPAVEKHYTVGMVISNIYVRNQLIRDCKKIGAEVCFLSTAEDLNGTDFDYYIFEREFFTDNIMQYVKNHPDMKCIVVCRFDAPTDINIPNVKLLRKPLYLINLCNVMGLSDYRVAEKEIDEKENFTFIAPEAKILIVDDNSINLTVAKGLLKPIKMMIDTALSASEAIQMVSKTKYDMIFMDHMMPEVDGIEATRIIRRMFPSYNEVPIIALTANAVSGAKEMFLREGMNDFVAKPIEVTEIISTLRKWLPQEKLQSADKADMEEEETETVDIRSIPGLNREKALSMLGDENLYITVLKEYYAAIQKNAESLRNHRFKEEWDQYTIEVHALKSTSRQIGAEELGEMAYELEMAGKQGNYGLIKEKNDRLLEEYLKYKDILQPYFPDVYKNEEESAYADSMTINNYIGEIRQALSEYDLMRVEDIIEDMEKYKYHDQCQNHLDNLKKYVAESDLDNCIYTIDSWQKCTEHCVLYNEVSNDALFDMLDTLQEALNNFDTLQIDDSVDALTHNRYPDEQQELLKKLVDCANMSDIDGCCEIVAKWRDMLS